jgi:hypothetical protein
LPDTCEGPSKEIDKKVPANERALRSCDDLSLSSKKEDTCAPLKPKFFYG